MFVRGLCFHLQKESIHAEENVCERERDSLVPVNKSVVIGKGFHERRGFLCQIAVVSNLGAKERGLETSSV